MNVRKVLGYLLILLSMFLMSGCNIFESNKPSNDSAINNSEPYEYTADDIRYYTKAGDKVASLFNPKLKRNYYKAFDGFCAVGLVNLEDSFGPILVGEDPVQVCFGQDYNKVITESEGSINIFGKTYYYSKADYFLSGHLDINKNHGIYLSKFENLQDAAIDIASKASFIPVDINAKQEFNYIEKDDGTYSISASGYSHGKEEIIIPSTYNGKKITSIDPNGFSGLNSLKYVRFERNSNITIIGKNAFSSCNSLKYVVIPETVKSIGSYAFYNCSDELMIYCEAESKPNDYYTNNGNSSSNWYGSAYMVWWGMIDYIESDDFIFGVKIDDTLSISKYIGDDVNVIVPSSYSGKTITSIGSYAFQGKNRIKQIDLPNTLSRISSYAFAKCSQLEKIHIPSGTELIGSSAFRECSSLKFAKIPETVKSIGSYAFYNCSDELMIYCEVESIPSDYYTNSGNSASNWRGSADMVWLGMIDYIEADDYIFGVKMDNTLSISKYIGNDVNVIIPSEYNGLSITKIGVRAFQGKNRIKQIIMPNTIINVGSYSFDGCSLLESVKLSTELTFIGNHSFYNCYSLKTVVIPLSVKTIESYSFYGCNSELKIYCEASSKPSGFYTNSGNSTSNWNGSGKVYYSGSWTYDDSGSPTLK